MFQSLINKIKFNLKLRKAWKMALQGKSISEIMMATGLPYNVVAYIHHLAFVMRNKFKRRQ